MRWGIAVLILLASHVASADEVDDLVAKGQELAKQSEYTQAIVAFKQADAKRPRAAHACMIGLAYMRREAWPQAELFLALCEKRAVPGDQPPDWIDQAEQQLSAKLSAAQIPAVTILVSPGNIGARLTVSSFAPDEVFDPQMIHLAPGKHVIEVTAPGYHTEHQEITVQPGQPQTVTFELRRENGAGGTFTSPSAPSKDSPPPAPSGPSKVPWIVTGAGAGLVGISIIYDVAVLLPAQRRLDQAETGIAYDHLVGAWRLKRDLTVGMFAVGAIAAGVGVALHFTVYKDGPQVTPQVSEHGGGIVVGWQR
ncbi:MAG TPA: carboxypeptidase-like regulatory domain-containing protein [Kofleriaceae bacterium]|nr:carboxypeptidase-like regulatory domain-containing protein [Kofleriaceae bacterium]